MSYPSLSIVTCLYNSDPAVWGMTLRAIRGQQYPHRRIEHIVMDAGSSNGSAEMARRFGCSVYRHPDLLDRAAKRMAMGIIKARGDLVLILEPDNIMPNRQWLTEMTKPFTDRSDIVGAFSWRNTFEDAMPLLTKYCALLGANDPTLYYLNKSEKIPWFASTYRSGRRITESDRYLVVEFADRNLPTLGDNGHLVRRKDILSVMRGTDTFIHVDAFADLVASGKNRFAVVKNAIIHFVGSDVRALYQNRVAIKEQFFNARYRDRSYYVFQKTSISDWYRLIRYVVFALTWVEPFLQSCNGYRTVPEPAWFLHPVVCWFAVTSYLKSEIRLAFRRLWR